MEEELKESTPMDIINKNFDKYREAFNVLPWDIEDFKKL